MHRFVLVMLVACGGEGVTRDQVEGVDAETIARDAIDDSTTADDAMKAACAEAAQHSDLSWIETNVFAPSCALMGCHTGAEAVVFLRLDPGFARESLVNASASTQTGWTRVVPGSPAASYLMVALGRADGPPPRDGTTARCRSAHPRCATRCSIRSSAGSRPALSDLAGHALDIVRPWTLLCRP
jgi:hypothetical protein